MTRPAGPTPWAASGCSWLRLARSRTEWARDYATQRGTEQLLVVRGGDPEQICAEVEAELRRVLAADRDDTRPMVVTLIAATEAKDQAAPPRRMARVGELPAMLVGVARAVQNVQDEALLEGRDLPMHGLVITRGALPVPGDREVPDLAASALVGARRVLRNEQTPLNWRLIDVDHGQPAEHSRPGVPGQRGLRE